MTNSTDTKRGVQTGVAKRLKVMTILIALFLAVFGAGLTYMYLQIEGGGRFLVAFTWAVGVLCYYILYCFWNVCTQIGADNSFSIENEKSMQRMGCAGLVISLIILVRVIVMLMMSQWFLFSPFYEAGKICLGLIFYIVCNALGRLIHNAYELKEDNDLTI